MNSTEKICTLVNNSSQEATPGGAKSEKPQTEMLAKAGEKGRDVIFKLVVNSETGKVDAFCSLSLKLGDNSNQRRYHKIRVEKLKKTLLEAKKFPLYKVVFFKDPYHDNFSNRTLNLVDWDIVTTAGQTLNTLFVDEETAEYFEVFLRDPIDELAHKLKFA